MPQGLQALPPVDDGNEVILFPGGSSADGTMLPEVDETKDDCLNVILGEEPPIRPRAAAVGCVPREPARYVAPAEAPAEALLDPWFQSAPKEASGHPTEGTVAVLCDRARDAIREVFANLRIRTRA